MFGISRRVARIATGTALITGCSLYFVRRKYSQKGYISDRNVMLVEHLKKQGERPPQIPKRENMKLNLQKGAEYDLLIIGGGATGAGVALDAVTRGLKVALVERDDFGSGTSSKSTKLLHGGVRYLEKAFRNLDYGQYKLVCEALKERANLLKISPHLSHEVPIMLPIYSWWKLPYYWLGAKVYDVLAGSQALESSYVLNKTKALEKFPMLNTDNLKGAIVYYDGQHNDSRMNVSLILTAASHGADVANHTEVIDLVKEERNGKETIVGATVRDNITGEEWDVRAKGVISAVGPYADSLRKLADPRARDIVAPSTGVHVVLPGHYGPKDMGLLDPETTDDRLLFFLPWQGHVVVGTTDVPTKLHFNPKPTEKEIAFILQEIQAYISPQLKVQRGDVLAAWSGIRPLVRDPNKPNTESLARTHVVEVGPTKLLSITGGKWTTYRSMAKDTVDKALEVFGIEAAHDCLTEHVLLVGAHRFSNLGFLQLVQQFGIDSNVAQHLMHSYGDRAFDVVMHAKPTGKRWPILGNQIVGGYPYIEAEVKYAVDTELAQTVVDVMARRTRLSFLNALECYDCVENVAAIMKKRLGWSDRRTAEEIAEARVFLRSMGLMDEGQSGTRFNRMQLVAFRKTFDELDVNRDGRLMAGEVLMTLRKNGIAEDISDEQVTDMIAKFTNDIEEEGMDFSGFLRMIASVDEQSRGNNISNVRRHAVLHVGWAAGGGVAAATSPTTALFSIPLTPFLTMQIIGRHLSLKQPSTTRSGGGL